MLNGYNETTGFTPLMQAAANGDLIGVRLLILAGADINKKSNYTYSFNADDELAFYMKPCDGDKFLVTVSCTALELALAGEHEECAAMLREAGAEEATET